MAADNIAIALIVLILVMIFSLTCRKETDFEPERSGIGT